MVGHDHGPYTPGYLAGHTDFAMTKRYVHPQADTVREAMAQAKTAAQAERQRIKPAEAVTNQRPASTPLREAPASTGISVGW